MPNLEIKKVEIGGTVDLMSVKAVASVHKSAETIFSGVRRWSGDVHRRSDREERRHGGTGECRELGRHDISMALATVM